MAKRRCPKMAERIVCSQFSVLRSQRIGCNRFPCGIIQATLPASRSGREHLRIPTRGRVKVQTSAQPDRNRHDWIRLPRRFSRVPARDSSKPPVAPIQLVQNIVKSSTGQYTCDGDGVHLIPYSNPPFHENYNWSGAGSLISWNTTVPATPPNQYFFMTGSIYSTSAISMQLAFSGGTHACTANISDEPMPVYWDIDVLGVEP